MTAPQPAVVHHVEEVTAAWLAAALEVEVRSAALEQIGTGQTGAAYRVQLAADGLPETMILKVAAGSPDVRMQVRGGYRCEVGYYAALAPRVQVATPRCWYAAIADDGLSFTLLLEDLSPRIPGVQADGCSAEQASDALANLAGLHGSTWNDGSLLEHRFLRLPNAEGAAFLGAYAVRAGEAFVERYGAELTQGEIDTLRAATAAVEAWLQARPEPFALLHGDYRLDNLLFPPAGPGVAVVDWQTLAVGLPARDLAYFLGTCLEPEERRASEKDLVAGYHAALLAHGVVDYDLDTCFDDYRVGHLQAPLITTIGSFNAVARTPDADGMFLAMARRSCAAIRDLGSLDQR